MIEISLQNVSKYYGANKVFDDITFEVKSEERVGLLGKNGTGKTTIFKIISNMEDKNGGDVFIRKGASIGYLAQIPNFPDSYKVYDVLNLAFDKLRSIKEEMVLLEEKMNSLRGENLDKALKKYGELQHIFEYKGGYEIDAKISKVCTGLKISDEFTKRKFNSLSGGEKTTVMLGKILLENPDILLLDEPTNHLDVESIEWLEDYLKNYKGAVLIISHDRYFLDNVVTKVVEIEAGKTSTYLGNYTKYVNEKKKMIEIKVKQYENQQNKIKSMEEAIKRFKDWGARGDNEMMFKKARNMQKRIERMEKIKKPIEEKTKMNLEFSSNLRSGKRVITVEGLTKAFDEDVILDNVDFFIYYGERVALIGKNGAGKSTLIKILLGQYNYNCGKVEIGSNVKIGYLEQNIFFKDEEKSILNIVRETIITSEENARRILASFDFYGDDVLKKVKNLSGGEKVRLKLCLLMNKDINFLLLDEPTNHLDINSRESLEDALLSFKGTILFISHDRYFINKLAERVIAIEDRKLNNYLGNYDYYLEKRKALEKTDDTKKSDKESFPKNHKKSNLNLNKKTRINNNNREKIKALEEEITYLEKQISQKDLEMSRCGDDYMKLNQIYLEKCKLQEKVDILLEKWALIYEE